MYKIDYATAAVAIAFLQGPTTADEMAAMLDGAMASNDVRQRISKLVDIGYLVEAGLRADGTRQDLERAKWTDRGWAEAYDYSLATWNYPFENYSNNGQKKDRARMRAYEMSEADVVRFLDAKGPMECELPDIEVALGRLDERTQASPASLRESLLDIASATALPIEWKESRTGGAAHMLRTSPSGGARHPSELYIAALDVEGLARGIYQIFIGDGSLRRVGGLPSDDSLREHLPGAFRMVAPTRAIFVVTSHFYRNMYRYREPRTLRTVFLDAGHLGGLLEALCNIGGLVGHGHHGFADSYLGALIGSSSLAEEAPTYTVAVGLRSEKEESAQTVGRSGLAQ